MVAMKLRRATMEDALAVLEWRNDAYAVAMSKSGDAVDMNSILHGSRGLSQTAIAACSSRRKMTAGSAWSASIATALLGP
jgi:hypothetical protein